jgi:hypothetical protein
MLAVSLLCIDWFVVVVLVVDIATYSLPVLPKCEVPFLGLEQCYCH